MALTSIALEQVGLPSRTVFIELDDIAGCKLKSAMSKKKWPRPGSSESSLTFSDALLFG